MNIYSTSNGKSAEAGLGINGNSRKWTTAHQNNNFQVSFIPVYTRKMHLDSPEHMTKDTKELCNINQSADPVKKSIQFHSSPLKQRLGFEPNEKFPGPPILYARRRSVGFENVSDGKRFECSISAEETNKNHISSVAVAAASNSVSQKLPFQKDINYSSEKGSISSMNQNSQAFENENVYFSKEGKTLQYLKDKSYKRKSSLNRLESAIPGTGNLHYKAVSNEPYNSSSDELNDTQLSKRKYNNSLQDNVPTYKRSPSKSKQQKRTWMKSSSYSAGELGSLSEGGSNKACFSAQETPLHNSAVQSTKSSIPVPPSIPQDVGSVNLEDLKHIDSRSEEDVEVTQQLHVLDISSMSNAEAYISDEDSSGDVEDGWQSDGVRNSILRKTLSDERRGELHSILKMPAEDTYRAPPSILKSGRESSEEKDLHSILKKSSSEDETIRPILKASTDEEDQQQRPRPILKKRTSFSEELKPILKKKSLGSSEDEQPRPILKNNRRKSEDAMASLSEYVTTRPRAYSADMGVKTDVS